MNNLRRFPTRTAVLRGFDPALLLDLDFRMGSGNDIGNANSRDLRYGPPVPITYSGADNGTYFDSSGILQTSGADEPRFNHDPVSGAPLGLLIEEARTNHFLNSDAPATQTSGALATGEHTLWMVGTGSVAVAANTATITGAGTATEGSPVTFDVTVGGTVDYTVTGSPTRVQSEKGFTATSYIPTVGSSVTRTGDAPSIALSDIPGFSTTKGTIFVEYNFPILTGIASSLVQIDDGTGGNRIYIEKPNTETIRATVRASASTTFQFTSTETFSAGASGKALLTWKANDSNAAFNGEVGTTDTGVIIPTGLTTLRIGNNHASLGQPNGNCACLTYRLERTSDTQLQVKVG